MRRRLSLRFKEKSLSTSNYVSKTSFKLWKFNVFIGSGGKTQHLKKKNLAYSITTPLWNPLKIIYMLSKKKLNIKSISYQFYNV